MDRQDFNQFQNHYSDSEEKEISLQDIFYILKRRFFWVVGVCAVVIAAVLVYLYLATPIFRASVMMRVEPTQAAYSLEGMLTQSGSSSRIATEVELIKSRSNIEEVIDRLGLYDQYVAQYEGDGTPSRSSLVSRIRSQVSVSTVRDTNIVQIDIENPERDQAMNIANTLAEVFNDMLKGIAQTEFQTRRQFIERQIPELEADLMVAEENLRRYKEEEGMVLMDEEARILLQEVTGYDRRITPHQIQVENSTAAADMIQELIRENGGSYPSLQEIRGNSEVADLLNEMRSLRLEFAGLSEGGADIRVSITSRENQLGHKLTQLLSRSARGNEEVPSGYYQELASTYRKILIAENNISFLSDLQASYADKIRTLPQIQQRMVELQRDVKVKESLYILLLEKLEETKITEAGITGTAVIVDAAIMPGSPVSPNRRLILAVGSLLGLFLGVLIAFLVETFDNTLRDEEAVRRAIGGETTILGRIPKLHIPRKGSDELLVYNDPTSPGAEAFKLISTNIVFSRVKPPQVIAISSSEMGEGKTTVTANVAAALAQNGLKTILVDSDMRRPRVEQIFRIQKTEGGVVNYLLQNREISTLIQRPFPDLQKLHILPVGPLPPNPTAVLTSEKFRHMIEGLRKVYDRIVLDLPPILVASDALICSRIADGLVLTVRAGTASKRGVAMTGESIRSSQIPLLGLVINDISADDRYGYYHYYYYYRGSDAAENGKAGRRAAQRSAKRALKAEKRKANRLKLQDAEGENRRGTIQGGKSS